MTKTKIDWVKNPDGSQGYVWNPVWGCLNTCPYCYVCNLAAFRRKTKEQRSFQPLWIESNFQKPCPKKPSTIFVNSMSDIAYWNPLWMIRVLDRMREHLHHNFLFLTKQPETYCYLDMIAPGNCWFGTTITTNYFPQIPLCVDRINFISVEPILEEIHLHHGPLATKQLGWIIVGAETGNRKGKVIPKLDWILSLAGFATNNRIPIWMKDNLRGIWPGELIQERPST